MISPYRQIIAACLIAFLIYWTWSARHVRPATRSESAASSLVSNLLMWFGVVSFALASLRRPPIIGLGLPDSAVRSIAGTALVVIGVGFAIWSRRVLGANWSRVARIAKGQELVTTGPYRLVRNPIYSGMLLAACGVALTTGNAIALPGLALIFASLWRKARVEERLLAAEFGEQYAAYARRVKRLIPFVL